VARVLVIEDNSANLELMVYLLRAFGHQPTAARDGRDGLDAAEIVTPDLILCDLHMPTLDGYAVARRLKADPRLRQVPLVAVTAYAMVGDRDKVLAAGFDGYIPKPITPETFVQQMEAFLHPSQRPAVPPPAPPLAADPAAATAPAAAPATGPQVLVVDDTLVNVDLLRAIMEPAGYRVTWAYPVSAALAQARHTPPDLIISDLRMPQADGFELLRQVQADEGLRAIPVIILSASAASAHDHAAALALGAARSIQRPIDARRLLAEVAACLQPAPPG